MMMDPYDQRAYRCRLEWGSDGAGRGAARGDILVIVDVLSFSTAVATAIDRGGIIHPCGRTDDIAEIARRVGGEAAVGRPDVPARGRFSLSPGTFAGIAAGTRVVLASLNGATCSRHAAHVPHLFVGAPVNARAVAGAVNDLLERSDAGVTVVACGERWDRPGEDGPLRVAIEDHLGAGSIITSLACEKSPEAMLAQWGFQSAHAMLPEIIAGCGSGRELIEKGFGDDVAHAARLDIYDTVPVMRNGALMRID
ncbi:MAG: 2-phosphosulfolactate phosphatase [Chlorobi bacterium]|nr:2-phosphosulfolactate phosphatase [Chlorobiota bacterium]